MKPYQAIDVAEYMVYYCLNTGKRMKHLHLQKTLYYLQASYLIKFNHPLFQEELHKWKLGGVVKEVYQEYKVFGADYIWFLPSRYVLDDKGKLVTKKFRIENCLVSMKDRLIIEDWINRLIQYEPFDLVYSHQAQQLWKNDQERILSGEENIIYSLDEIKTYFQENPSFLHQIYEGRYKSNNNSMNY